MAQDKNNRRVNVLIPAELYEKFQDFSQAEYKTTTAKIVDWMVAYVQEREKAAKRSESFQRTLKRLMGLIQTISRLRDAEDMRNLTRETHALMQKLMSDPSIADSPEFLAEMLAVERRINHAPTFQDDDIPF